MGDTSVSSVGTRASEGRVGGTCESSTKGWRGFMKMTARIGTLRDTRAHARVRRRSARGRCEGDKEGKKMKTEEAVRVRVKGREHA
eukprot:3516687-Rhodomonas_salina.1